MASTTARIGAVVDPGDPQHDAPETPAPTKLQTHPRARPKKDGEQDLGWTEEPEHSLDTKA